MLTVLLAISGLTFQQAVIVDPTTQAPEQQAVYYSNFTASAVAETAMSISNGPQRLGSSPNTAGQPIDSGNRPTTQPERLPQARGMSEPANRTSGDMEKPLNASHKQAGKLSLSPPQRKQLLPTPQSRKAAAISTLATVVSALGIVLALFLAFAWLLRRTNRFGGTELSSEVFEVLGRAALTPQQQLQLVRLGNRLLLLCVNQHGAETLTEFTDPKEVTELMALCKQTQPGSVTQSFEQLLKQISIGR